MNRNTKILLIGIITGAVATQLLNMIYFRQPVTIGGEIFIPILIILIRQAVIKIRDIFTGIKDDLKEICGGKTDEYTKQIPENASQKQRSQS